MAMHLVSAKSACRGKSRAAPERDLYHGDVCLQEVVQGFQAGAQQPRHHVCVVHQVVELQLRRACAPGGLRSPLHRLRRRCYSDT